MDGNIWYFFYEGFDLEDFWNMFDFDKVLKIIKNFFLFSDFLEIVEIEFEKGIFVKVKG